MGILEFVSVVLICIAAVLASYFKFRIPPKPPEPPCNHEWEIFKQVNVVDDNGVTLYNRYHLRCKKCGDMKCKDMH